MGISHVLQVIRCLLIVPFPESSLNDEAGKMFMESYDDYAERARLMTRIHALKKIDGKSSAVAPSAPATPGSSAAAPGEADVNAEKLSVAADKDETGNRTSRSTAAAPRGTVEEEEEEERPREEKAKKKQTACSKHTVGLEENRMPWRDGIMIASAVVVASFVSTFCHRPTGIHL